MNAQFQGKHALVTGGNKGIGFAICQGLLAIDLAAKNLSQEIDSLDVLINNAGISPDQGVDILAKPRELLNQTMDINAFGAIRVTQAFLLLLTKSSAARVINTSSGYGQLESLSADVLSYCLSKLAQRLC